MTTKQTTQPPSLTLPKFARNTPPIIPLTSSPVVSSPTFRLAPSPKVPKPISSPKVPSPKVPSPKVPSVPNTPLRMVLSPSIPKTPYNSNAPKTPLYLPRIATPKCKPVSTVDENPWLPPKVDGGDEVKFVAITPIGTVPLVPTCSKRAPPTPRTVPVTPGRKLTMRVVNDKGDEVKIDPLLTTAIYLDCNDDRNYHHVTEHMRSLTTITTSLQKQYITSYRPLTKMSGRVSVSTFEEALSIYENNQVYYQDRIDDKTLSENQIKHGLTELEHWFIHIIEHQPKDKCDQEAWIERENIKLSKGISAYCDPELYKYISPLDDNKREHVKRLQGRL